MSGVTLSKTWVSGLPENWNWVRASHIVNAVNRPVVPGDEIVTCFRDGEVTLRSNRRTDGFTVSLKEIGYQHIEKGDLVIHSMDGGWGAIGVSDSDGKASPVVHAYKSPSNDVYFLAYVLRAMAYSGYLSAQTKGIRERSTQFDKNSFFNLYMPLPDLDTQHNIADYLDTEVGEMDAMVARLESLIADLEARRAKVIGYTLSEHAKSASGEWPHHAFKFLLTTHFAGDWGEDVGKSDLDLPCVRVADFERTTSSLAEEIPTVRSYAEKTVERKHLEYNDLLVEKSGGGEKTPVGSVVLYQGGDNALCANFIEVMRLNGEQYPPFWVHMFRANFVDGETFRFVKQTTGIQNLDMQMFLDQVFVVPPLEQQRRIAAELDEETAAIDGIIARSRTLIDDLKARKSALITEVVTGRKQV